MSRIKAARPLAFLMARIVSEPERMPGYMPGNWYSTPRLREKGMKICLDCGRFHPLEESACYCANESTVGDQEADDLPLLFVPVKPQNQER